MDDYPYVGIKLTVLLWQSCIFEVWIHLMTSLLSIRQFEKLICITLVSLFSGTNRLWHYDLSMDVSIRRRYAIYVCDVLLYRMYLYIFNLWIIFNRLRLSDITDMDLSSDFYPRNSARIVRLWNVRYLVLS